MMPKLSELGEKKMVSRLLASIGPTGGIGLGDDAAAIPLGDRFLVVSTDLIAHRTHMPPAMSAYQKGWMAAAVNLSDMAAMGATPMGVVMAYGLPRDTEADDLLDMARGVQDCCEECSAEYLGGDTKESSELVIVGTSLGLVRSDGILRRKGAKPGDMLAVTGSIGLAATGFAEISSQDYDDKARKAALQPRPRTKEGIILSASSVVTSCLDTSDGLAMSIHELAKASGVGFRIDMDRLPFDKTAQAEAQTHGWDATDLGLYGGGDYQLLFTVSPEGKERARDMLGDDLTFIGEATDGTEILLRDGQGERPLPNRGYEHFKG
jgi:thiamine-monophosphate kinase